MWDRSDEDTPPPSPTVVPFAGRVEAARPELRKDRESVYYRNLIRQKRSKEPATDAAEQQFGWGGNAAAIGEADRSSAGDQPDWETISRHRKGVTIEALVDPKDLPDLPYAAPQTNRQHAHSKEGNLFRRLLRALSLGRGSRAPARTRGTLVRAGSRSTRPRVMSAYEAQTNQRTLELAMERRRARGSVLYERGTGVARIPLYAAPTAAAVTSAPALSSFAPIGPIGAARPNYAQERRGSDASVSNGRLPTAKACATIDRDGTLLSVNRQKGFSKGPGNRYSAFVQRENRPRTPTEPLPPLPQK